MGRLGMILLITAALAGCSSSSKSTTTESTTPSISTTVASTTTVAAPPTTSARQASAARYLAVMAAFDVLDATKTRIEHDTVDTITTDCQELVTEASAPALAVEIRGLSASVLAAPATASSSGARFVAAASTAAAGAGASCIAGDFSTMSTDLITFDAEVSNAQERGSSF